MVAKLMKGENVSIVVLVKICEAIDCNVDVLWILFRRQNDKADFLLWT